jgi:Flp pilus assembly protein TadD
VLLLQNDPGALKVAEAALAKSPSAPHVLGTAGWAAHKAGQSDRALQLLRDARLRDPTNLDTRYFLGAVLASSGRQAEARQELQSALQVSTTFAHAKAARELLQTLK